MNYNPRRYGVDSTKTLQQTIGEVTVSEKDKEMARAYVQAHAGTDTDIALMLEVLGL